VWGERGAEGGGGNAGGAEVVVVGGHSALALNVEGAGGW